MEITYVFLGGLGNSEPDHWQSIWYRSVQRGVWLAHDDWNHPKASDWIADLRNTLSSISGSKVLIAHSLGCLLAAAWARTAPREDILGAFLVAVPDVSAPCFPQSAVGFTPSREPLPLRAFVVASQNDPYASFDYSERLAADWQVSFVDVGAKGHINLQSGLEIWPAGCKLLEAFVADAAQDLPSR